MIWLLTSAALLACRLGVERPEPIIMAESEASLTDETRDLHLVSLTEFFRLPTRLSAKTWPKQGNKSTFLLSIEQEELSISSGRGQWLGKLVVSSLFS